MPKTTVLAAAAISALSLALGAQATTLPYKSFDKLVAESDGIVVATVRQVRSMTDASRDINTYVTFDDLKVIEGKVATPTLTLRLRGGRVDNEALFIDGTPDFTPDERVVLFVQGNGRDLVPLVGWSQGLFRLQPDAAGELTVANADGKPVLGVKDNHVLTLDGQGVAQEDVHLAGAPHADFARRLAARGQAGAGTTDDGSLAEVAQVKLAKPARPMAAAAFLALVQERSAGRNAQLAGAAPLKSIEPGSRMLGGEHADTRAMGEAANTAAPAQGPEFSRPALPQRSAPAVDDLQ